MRSNSATVEFEHLDIFKDVLNFTRGKTFSMEIQDSQIEVSVRKIVSPSQYEEEKETRTLTRTLAELAGIEQSQES